MAPACFGGFGEGDQKHPHPPLAEGGARTGSTSYPLNPHRCHTDGPPYSTIGPCVTEARLTAHLSRVVLWVSTSFLGRPALRMAEGVPSAGLPPVAVDLVPPDAGSPVGLRDLPPGSPTPGPLPAFTGGVFGAGTPGPAKTGGALSLSELTRLPFGPRRPACSQPSPPWSGPGAAGSTPSTRLTSSSAGAQHATSTANERGARSRVVAAFAVFISTISHPGSITASSRRSVTSRIDAGHACR